MKRNLLFVFGLFVSIGSIAQQQFNPFTNQDHDVVSFYRGWPDVRVTAPMEIECKENTFWSLLANTAIIEWEIVGNTVNYIDTLFTAPPTVSLAYCRALNPSTWGNTFYGSNGGNGNVIYYDGTAWTNVVVAGGPPLHNSAGFGHDLYYQHMWQNLVHYDGANLTTVYTLPAPAQFSVADLAVDVNGNAFCFISSTGLPLNSDQLIAVSPAGTLLHTYNVSINTNNGYGSFFLNNVLYLGLGSAHPTYPNTLMPFTIFSDTAIMGTPIPFNPGNSSDLASCWPGNPLAVSMNEYYSEEGVFNVYPNPAYGFFTVEFDGQPSMVDGQLLIYDVMGREVYSKQIENSKQEAVNCKLNAGLYFVKVSDVRGQSYVQKLIIR